MGAPGIEYMGTRDTTKHPTTYRTAPTTKNDLAHSVSSAKAEKHFSRV